MNRQAQFGLDRPREFSSTGRIFASQLYIDKRHHFWGKLVSTSGPPLLRKQAGEPMLRKSRLGLIEGGAGNTKERGSLCLLRPLDAHLTKHLVLHLDQVAGIEEPIGLKPGRTNLLRVSVEGPTDLETFDFGIALGQKCGIRIV